MVRSVAGACVALLMCAYLAVSAVAAFPYQPGADFYQFWGVPVAKRAVGARDTPYVDAQGYAQVLNGISDASSSEKLHAANSMRRVLEPMGTPFLYAIFALFPRDYERAQGLFVTLIYVSAGLGLFLLARLRGLAVWTAACVALAVELTFAPFMVDVRAANVNSLQLAFIAASIAYAARPVHCANALAGGIYLGLLAVFVVFKPNMLWIALALAIHYGLSRGVRSLIAGSGVAALFAIAAGVVGALYFQDSSAWREWLSFAGRMEGGLPLTLEEGNQSIAMFLSRHAQSFGAIGYGLIIGAAVLLAFLIAMSAAGKRTDLLLPAAKRAFASPWFAANIGVLFTFATSPLVWSHYFVLALVPIVWLFGRDGVTGVGTWGAVLCYCALSRVTIDFLITGDQLTALYAVTLLSWVALLPGLLAYAAEQRRSLEAAA